MSKAEEWRRVDLDGFESALAYIEALERMDPTATVQQTDLGAVIEFSDGSKHLMGGEIWSV